MSYSHDQRRKFIRRLKHHLKEIHPSEWQKHFREIMMLFQSEENIPELMKNYGNKIKPLGGHDNEAILP